MRKSLFIFALFVGVANSARILAIFPMPSPSHYFLGSALTRELAERGHEVTMISCIGEKTQPKGKYRDIVTEDFKAKVEAQRDKMNFFEMDGGNPFILVPSISYMTAQTAEEILSDKNVQKLLHSQNETFDVVIVEQFMNDAHKALATHFKAPLILFSTLGPNFWTNPLVGNPSPPSYISDIFLGMTPPLSFLQRVYNTLFTIYMNIFYNNFMFPLQNKIIQNQFPNGPHIDQVLYNSSIMLLNSHPSFGQAVPTVPNMVEIGGFHVKPSKKLPKDLQDYLDNAKEGVVYFSMGSNLKSAQMPLEKRNAIIQSFGKLKQKVLWKWEEETLANQPANVKLGKWLPQADILAHPNVKLFITHGGLLSTTESIYHGKPVLTIPIFGDQKLNAMSAVHKGYGLMLPYKELTEEVLTGKLNELLSNPSYAQKAKKMSELFHDRPIKPMDLAIYWVEYVARNGGAPHLRVAALDLNWWQYHLLDVFAFLAIVSVSILALFVLVVKKLCCRKRVKNVVKEKQN